jgi:iron complex outermembrane receptor protein
VELYRGYVDSLAVRSVARWIWSAPCIAAREAWMVGGLGIPCARERLGFAAPLGRQKPANFIAAGYAGSVTVFRRWRHPLLRDDDGILRRQNADYQRLSGQLRIDARRGQLQLAQQNFAWWKLQGVPGTAAAPSPDASTSNLVGRSITRVRLAFGDGGGIEWVGSGVVEQRSLRDLGGQVGLAADDEHALTSMVGCRHACVRRMARRLSSS